MPDESTQQMVRAWLGIAVQVGVAATAIYLDRIRKWLGRPKLKVEARTAPPDSDLTFFPLELSDTEGKAVGVERAHCHYFRLRVRNEGGQLAEKVEIYVEFLERLQVDSTFKLVDKFPPMNLKWAHTGGTTRDLARGMEKFCDLGFIVDPRGVKKNDAAFAPERARSNESSKPDAAVFTFDLEVKPNHAFHIVIPGTYRAHLAVGAANVEPIRLCLEMTFSGNWFDDTARMYSEGILFKFIDVKNQAFISSLR